MPINITMPALSPTMEEGNLAKWLVKEGDTVGPGDVIAEIETDKATMEVEAVDEGTVAKIVVAEGTEAVKVNALIAILAEDGEDVAEAAKGGGDAPAQAAAAPAEAPKQEAAPAPAAAPVAPAAAPAPAAPAASGARTFSSPLARRIAKDAGLDISAIAGSGPKGRVVKRDVDAAIAGGVQPAAAAAATPAAARPIARERSTGSRSGISGTATCRPPTAWTSTPHESSAPSSPSRARPASTTGSPATRPAKPVVTQPAANNRWLAPAAWRRPPSQPASS